MRDHPHRLRFHPVLLILTSLLLLPASAQDMARSLTPGESLRGTLAQHGKATFSVALDEGLFVYGEVNQITVDVVITVKSPDGKDEWTFDNPARGPEPFQLKTKAAGVYAITVTPFQEETGEFTIELPIVQPIATTPEGRVDQALLSLGRTKGMGAVVYLTERGKPVIVKSFGFAQVEYEIPNTTTTPYHLASVSKQFTAFAICLLAQDGKLSLDDDVRTYVPELHDFGTAITLRHLLNHTSGLRDQWNLWSMSGGRMDDVIRTEDLMTLMTNQRELNFEPGAEYLYCNSGYMLLAQVVARVSGISYKEFMQERVFGPLGMRDSHIHDDHQHVIPGRAYSYTHTPEGLKNAVLSYANAGATSQFSSAEDLAKWVDNWRTKKVGGEEVIDAMQVRGVLNSGDTIDYALGISVSTYKGQRMLSHGGGDAGFRTYLAYFPDLEVGVITLGNLGSFNSGRVAFETAEAFYPDAFREPPVFDSGSPAPDPEPPAEPWKPTVDELRQYTGRYYSEELEAFYTITLKDSVLMGYQRRVGDITLTPQDAKGHFRGSEFVLRDVKFEDGEMFVSNGRVRDLRMKRVGGEMLRTKR